MTTPTVSSASVSPAINPTPSVSATAQPSEAASVTALREAVSAARAQLNAAQAALREALMAQMTVKIGDIVLSPGGQEMRVAELHPNEAGPPTILAAMKMPDGSWSRTPQRLYSWSTPQSSVSAPGITSVKGG